MSGQRDSYGGMTMTGPDEETQRMQRVTPTDPAARRRRSLPVRILKWVGIALVALFLVAIVGSILAPVEPTAQTAAPPPPPTTEPVAPPPPAAPEPTTEPPPPPPPAAPAAPPASPRERSNDEADAALTIQQKREYVLALVADVPSTRERVDRRGGDLDGAAESVARDGVRICEAAADPNRWETAEARDRGLVIQVQGRFPTVSEADVPTVLATTEEWVCSRIAPVT